MRVKHLVWIMVIQATCFSIATMCIHTLVYIYMYILYPNVWMRYTTHPLIHPIQRRPHLEQSKALAVFRLKESLHALAQSLWVREELVPIILRTHEMGHGSN